MVLQTVFHMKTPSPHLSLFLPPKSIFQYKVTNQKIKAATKEDTLVRNVPHMNTGNGETSYAKNSTLQKKIILRAKPALDEALEKVYIDNGLPSEAQCLKIADLGCSSGPNTLFVISEIIDTIHGLSKQSNCKLAPELQIYLNDLSGNDFNNIFKSLLPAFYNKLKEKGREDGSGPFPCFVSGTPGSFYSRLFPSKSLHFIHSSSSLMWLSQDPEKVENKGNIYLARMSPPEVHEAYLKQFQKDFSTFLSMRSEEMVSSGRMVLTFTGRSIADPTSKYCTLWELLTKSLLDLVSEGLIQEEEVDSLNIPYYTPYKDEVETIIEKEGSFNIVRLEVFERNWDPNDDDNAHESGKNISKLIRAGFEPLLARHFGDLFDLFEKFSKHLADHICHEKVMITFITVSLSKK